MKGSLFKGQPGLKALRVVIAVLLFVFTSLLFVDFREWIPTSIHSYVLFPQFLPSLLLFVETLSWISAGFLVVLVLTLLFGRVYCSFLCPLGIFQDVIAYLSRKFKWVKRYKYAKPKNILRHTILLATAIFLVLNIVLLATLLDPYSNFGRIMNGLARPLVIAGNNLLAAMFEKMDIYYFAPYQIKTNFLAVLFPLALTGILIYMAGKWGRLFCNTVCPVGSLLGLVSKYSVFQIRVDKSACTLCGKCAVACKAQCISVKSQAVDMTRCVGCMNCIVACDTRGIKYRFSKDRHRGKTDLSKRGFLQKGLGSIIMYLGLWQNVRSQQVQRPGQSLQHYKPTKVAIKKNYFVSPPGSEAHSHFNSKCTGCHLCVAACPTKVLQPSLLQYGLKGFMQPFMDYDSKYCNFDCTRCSEVCPTGAILPMTLEEKKSKQLGIVVFIEDNCVVKNEETSCGSCAEHCPTKAVRMVPYKNNLTIPETNTSICIGCGACEYACPMEPYKAIYVDGHAVHQQAKKPKIEALEVEETEDFPF
jgi:ferredoxin-type protein NapF